MKVLLVDDEKHVRECIDLLVDWSEWQVSDVYEAENGSEAIALMKRFHPEIVFTDIRMPITDGLGLIEWISKEAPGTKVVVISGYNDFEYVRQAMKNGAFDYLLKPIKPQQLYEVLGKVVQAYETENVERLLETQKNERLVRYESSYLEKTILSLLDCPEHIDQEGVDRLFQTPFSLIAIDLFLIPAKCPTMRSESFITDTIFSIQRLVGNNGFAFRRETSQGGHSSLILILLYGDLTTRIRLTSWLLHRLDYMMGGKILSASSAVPFDSPAMLVSVEKELEDALASHVIWRSTTNPADMTADEIIPRLWDKERLFALQSNDVSLLENALDRWEESLLARRSCIDVRQFKSWWAGYCIDFQRIAQELHVAEDHELHVRISCLQQPLPVTSAEGGLSVEFLRSLILDDLRLLFRCVGKKNLTDSNLFYQMAEYIRQHSSEEISLDALSDLFNRNATYISRRFKEILGKSVIDYLTDIRIQDAQTLLRNEDLKIPEIAEKVGYHDEKYFMRIFKRRMGMTPYEYRTCQDDGS